MAAAHPTSPVAAPDAPLDPEVEELWSSRALLLVLLLLIVSLWTSYYLKIRRIKSVHETIVALFAGMFVGLCIRVLPGNVMQGMLAFKNTILLNVLLPPIILNSGFELKQDNFFRNFATILAFAFAGTFISAVVLGVLVYIWALLGLEGLSLGIIECLQFGSTLSATDPVTILSIFNAFKVDPKLYSVIFGESLLNDAVAIVMFETLAHFHGAPSISVLSFFHGVGIFLLVFCISMACGVLFGLACSLMLKHSSLAQFPGIESCLVLIVAYTSYFFSNALSMSGIVSLLFCGITLKHYAYHNMSRKTQRTTKYMFGILAQLSENFIFIYLGLSLFTQMQLIYKPLFILVTALGVCVARYCAVFPISKLINLVARGRAGNGSQSAQELPHSYQMMLFWAGLRGAVGVALAAGLKGDNAPALQSTVLVTVVLTMIVFGGTTSRMIEILAIRTGVEDDDESSDDEVGAFLAPPGRDRSASAGWSNKFALKGDQYSMDAADTPYRDRPVPINTKLSVYGNPSAGPSTAANSRHSLGAPLQRNASQVSLDSVDSYDDAEPLPTGTPGDPEAQGLDSTVVWRDGQWFNVLDERYLLPVFSNATASRKEAKRKAMRKSRVSLHDPYREDSPELDLSRSGMSTSSHLDRGTSSSQQRSQPETRDITIQQVISSLMGTPSTPTFPAGIQTQPSFPSHKRRDSNESPSGAPQLSSGHSSRGPTPDNASGHTAMDRTHRSSTGTIGGLTAASSRRQSSQDALGVVRPYDWHGR